jgi:hypothetical protein
MTDPTVTPHGFDPSARSRLNAQDLGRFPGDTLFARLGRAVCEVEALPRKELFEAWEVARRVRRHMRGGRVIDMAAGHGLLGWVMLLLDDTSPEAICVDTSRPLSAQRLTQHLSARWPRLLERVHYVEADLATVALTPQDLIVCVHGCGALTDRVLTLAAAARARVAVLPCCHDLAQSDTARLDAWMPGPLAVDVARVHRLRALAYDVRLATIPDTITPQNRLIMATPLPPTP